MVIKRASFRPYLFYIIIIIMIIAISSFSHYVVSSLTEGRQHESLLLLLRARGSVVLKALCYKPEGHGFETR
jgi:hypothetical protein